MELRGKDRIVALAMSRPSVSPRVLHLTVAVVLISHILEIVVIFILTPVVC